LAGGALAVALGFVYLSGIASFPLRWEEPRRALVATEMIARGDYVVSRLLGRPYLNKPPMHSWAIAAASGFDPRRVGPLAVRLPSVLAVAVVAAVLWRLGTSSTSGPRALPALVFLTLGILPQYGRPGEIDLPFTALVTAALAAFEAGRRRGSPLVQWVASQGLVGAGVLTKGFAPVFVHPPAALVAWRRGMRVRPWAVGLGLLLMLGVVAAWLVPYSRSGPILALSERLSAEVAQRTTDAPAGEALRHLVRYPIVLLVAAAPWSLALLWLAHPRGREAARGLARDPWTALALAVVAWGVLVFAFVPGTLPRYLIPVLPFASVLAAALLERLDRPGAAAGPWLALAAAWVVAVPLLAGGRVALPGATVAATLAAGLLAVAGARELARRRGAAAAGLLAAGLLYGIGYAGLVDARAAARHRAFEQSAAALAPQVRPGVPLVVAERTDRRFTWPLVQRVGRLAVEDPPEPPYDLVGPLDTPLPERARPVAESGGFGLWRVRRVPRPGP
jgi:4-amino-4-deoxy-L-arabinose transferase-like glycosyltransferase